MLLTVLQVVLVALGLVLAAGTLLGLSNNPHWFIRLWDFPRIQVIGGLLLAGAPYAGLFFQGRWYDWAFLMLLAACIVWQCYQIIPYTLIMPRSVLPSDKTIEDPTSFRMVISNVLMENDQTDLWMRIVREADPDLIFAAEVNDEWLKALEPLEKDYPHTVRQPQDNHYGMALYSRLELSEPEVHFIVQDDIPSIHVWVTLRSGERFRLHGLHPRPPEPLRDQDSTPRDAELVLAGRDIREETQRRPTLVVGDLNDVAWSATTRLFLRISGLLDPRRGRGFYCTYNANNPLFRFPLDHVFHSNDFKLIDLHRLSHVGSDHFPVCITLNHESQARGQQPETEMEPGDEHEAQQRIDEQVEEELNGEEEGHLSRPNKTNLQGTKTTKKK